MSILTRWPAVLLCVGCAVLPGRRGGGGQTVGLTEKPVVAKEPPTSLIAADGTRCLVSEQKYRDTALGSPVWCFWTGNSP